MNANELADYLENDFQIQEAVIDMLRQQQAEIEALKKEAALQRLSDFTQEADNEPVAWAREDGVIAFFEKPEVDKQGFKWFPLYTHPAKTLTDEEIKALWKPFPDTKYYDSDILNFARAILRKAQEK